MRRALVVALTYELEWPNDAAYFHRQSGDVWSAGSGSGRHEASVRRSSYTLNSDNACVFSFSARRGLTRVLCSQIGPLPLFLRVKQVAPFLKDIGSYTVLGPALRKRKVDVDHIIASTKGMTVGGLMDQVNFRVGRWGRSIAAPFRRRG